MSEKKINQLTLIEDGILDAVQIAGIEGLEFDLSGGDEREIIWERYETISDEANYTERLSYNTGQKNWSAVLRIVSDSDEQTRECGRSDGFAEFSEAVKWLEKEKAGAEKDKRII